MCYHGGNFCRGEIMPSSVTLKPDFIATRLPNLLVKEADRRKTTRIILGVFSFGVSELIRLCMILLKEKLLARLLIPSAFYSEKRLARFNRIRDAYLAENPNLKPVVIQTIDKVNLEAYVVKAAQKSDKWIIKYCGNGEVCGGSLLPAHQLANDIGANVLVFNYRGVNDSEGRPKDYADLVLDGAAAMEYLLRYKKVKQEDVLHYGYSLGSAIAAKVCCSYKGSKYLGDRAFSKGSMATKYLMPNKYLGNIASFAVKILGTEANVAKLWHQIGPRDKLLIYHRLDGVIKHPASLYKYLKNDIKKRHMKYRVIKSNGNHGLNEKYKPNRVRITYTIAVEGKPKVDVFYHMMTVQEWDPEAYTKIVKGCQNLLSIKAA